MARTQGSSSFEQRLLGFFHSSDSTPTMAFTSLEQHLLASDISFHFPRGFNISHIMEGESQHHEPLVQVNASSVEYKLHDR